MEALSRLVAIQGAIISGSDAGIAPGHVAGNVHKGIDMIVVNGAIADDNVEVVRARELGIAIIDRAELLAEIESQYKNRIAIAGTHGKSTTTAMIGAVLVAGGLNPTVHNGARPNLILGGKDFFVTEACEFKRSFLKLNPTVAVVTNIEYDHVDCYKSLKDVQRAFDKFTAKAGTVIRNRGRIWSFAHSRGKYGFLVGGVRILLNVPGKHNVQNAALAVKVGLHFGIDIETIKRALEAFNGIERRFQQIGEGVITDYAHHPAEIETTIKTATDIYGEGKFLIVFQPHTFSRTIALFDDFVRVLRQCDCVMYKTYSAREKSMDGGTAADLATAVGVRHFSNKVGLKNYLAKVSGNYRAIILTGAGDINRALDE